MPSTRVRRTAVAIAILLAAGCSRSPSIRGRLESRSLGQDPVVLETDYSVVLYRLHDAGVASFVLTDVGLDDLLDGTVQRGQLLHVELHWAPRAGQTPMDDTATNATLRHVVVADGEVGVYMGAGFALPSGTPGDERLTVTVSDGTMRLAEATAHFRDPLSPARLTGTYTATLDTDRTRRFERALSQFVTNVLGERTLVGE